MGRGAPDVMISAMPASAVVEFLRRNPVFAAVPDKEIQALAAVTRTERYRTHEFIFMEGDPAAGFYLVQSGHVKILRQARSGREVVLELLGRASRSAEWP
jgi:CRP-like cAMP-binding protein